MMTCAWLVVRYSGRSTPQTHQLAPGEDGLGQLLVWPPQRCSKRLQHLARHSLLHVIRNILLRHLVQLAIGAGAQQGPAVKTSTNMQRERTLKKAVHARPCCCRCKRESSKGKADLQR